MLIRLCSSLLLCITSLCMAEFCGNNKIPFGLEVHKNGKVVLLCSKPNCFDKKYADCDERPLRTDGCPSNSSWVGGLQRTVDGSKLYTQCCEFPLLAKYAQLIYEKVIVRRGEFFEGEEKQDDNEDVYAFDIITNMAQRTDEKGEFYELQVHRYQCGKVPDEDPVWLPKNPWPRFKVKRNE